MAVSTLVQKCQQCLQCFHYSLESLTWAQKVLSHNALTFTSQNARILLYLGPVLYGFKNSEAHWERLWKCDKKKLNWLRPTGNKAALLIFLHVPCTWNQNDAWSNKTLICNYKTKQSHIIFSEKNSLSLLKSKCFQHKLFKIWQRCSAIQNTLGGSLPFTPKTSQ